MEGARLLLSTLMLRPYVFIFLAAYLALAVPAWGWRRTILYTVLGYALAWAAEYSSIHNGFPFGLYSYIQAPTADKELWVAGVPFMDSLSFVFLTFAGLHMGCLAVEPIARGPRGAWDLRWASLARPVKLSSWALAGIFTMGLDLIIDPVALRGERWFLGRIYEYAHHGFFFGVPLSNFIGWALLAWTITGVFALLERFWLARRLGAWRGYPGDAALGVGLYVGILLFNLGITFAIGEIWQGFIGCLLSVALLAPVLVRMNGKIPAVSPG
jgi:putative membrane protein